MRGTHYTNAFCNPMAKSRLPTKKLLQAIKPFLPPNKAQNIRIDISKMIGTTKEKRSWWPTLLIIRLEHHAPDRNSNIHVIMVPALLHCLEAICSANNAAWPVTFVVNAKNPKKPAALVKPATELSRIATRRLC